jgi:hypothetical protein
LERRKKCCRGPIGDATVKCTIDASVFVASARYDEPKCAAAIARQTNDPALAKELVSIIEDFPGINLISLDLPLARRAAQIAVEYRLRGADAAYVAVADAFDATLVSWDQEMLKRCPAAVATMTPESWCGAR